jgi:hypothetical protein
VTEQELHVWAIEQTIKLHGVGSSTERVKDEAKKFVDFVKQVDKPAPESKA